MAFSNKKSQSACSSSFQVARESSNEESRLQLDEELRITEMSKKVVGNLDKKAKEFEEKHHFAEKAEKRIRSGLKL